MSAQKNLFLIGPMGAGKTTLGRFLAEQLGCPFTDSDKEIEARTGADIPWIFEKEGEIGFRNRETAMIDELTQQQGVVLATGGGAILRESNRNFLRQRGIVFYLYTTVDTQLDRTRYDRNRPLLQKANRRTVLEQLLAERDPLYRQVADYVVPTMSNNLKRVAAEVLACFEQAKPR